MADALYPFNLIQIGRETTKGTLVAATRKLVGDGTFTEEQDFYRPPYATGRRGNVGGAGVITRKGMMLDVATDLTAEEILWLLETGIKGQVAGVDSAGDVTWTFEPELTTGVPTIDTATVELVRSDGVTNHYYGEFGYAMCSKFKIEWAFNEPVKLSYTMFGRARQPGAPTAALAAYTTREVLVAPLLSMYLDTSWAGLGTTQLTGIARSGSIEITTGFEPDYKTDGRADKDFSKHKVGNPMAVVSLVLEEDAVGAARWADYRANSLVFMRFKFLGNTIVAAPKTVQVDLALRCTSPPSEGPDGQQQLITTGLESVVDDTSGKTMLFTIINALTAI